MPIGGHFCLFGSGWKFSLNLGLAMFLQRPLLSNIRPQRRTNRVHIMPSEELRVDHERVQIP
jgi:hypothetical protein